MITINKIKRWIIHKLGGIIPSDYSLKIQTMIAKQNIDNQVIKEFKEND
jgi:hypothetical protein